MAEEGIFVDKVSDIVPLRADFEPEKVLTVEDLGEEEEE